MTGAEGLPAPRDAGNVLRPFTTLKLSVRLPPDVDAAAASDALISAIRTDEGARVTIDLEAAGQGWVAPPLDPATEAAVAAASIEHFGRPPGYVGEGGSIRSWPISNGASPEPVRGRGVLGPHSTLMAPTSRSTSRPPRP